jgi:hypothetical protein
MSKKYDAMTKVRVFPESLKRLLKARRIVPHTGSLDLMVNEAIECHWALQIAIYSTSTLTKNRKKGSK